MYCKYCGTEIEEGSVFCKNCGAKIESTEVTETQGKKENKENKENKEKKKSSVMKKFLIAAVIFIIIGAVLSSLGGDDGEGNDEYVVLVQNGYLGEFTDATIEEIVEANFEGEDRNFFWSSQEMDGERVVGFFTYLDGEDLEDATGVLFRICSDETFRVEDYTEGGNEEFESTEIADILNHWYITWYVKNEIGADASAEELYVGVQELIENRLDQISAVAVLYGASQDYSGERSELSKVIDGIENEEFSITELSYYYYKDILEMYTEGANYALGQLSDTELSSYADYTEDELIKELGVSQNPMGYYPDDDAINFMCVDGKVYLIMLRIVNTLDANYSLFGIRVGEEKDVVLDRLGEDFTLLESYAIEGGQREAYMELATGYLLGIDYGEDDKITNISYTLEDMSEMYSDPPEDLGEYSINSTQSGEETEDGLYEIIPGYTYMSDQSNEEYGDFRLYMNLVFNEDRSISVYGWGYENYILSDNCFVEETVFFSDSDEYASRYDSDDGNFSLIESLQYGFYTAMSDYNYFTGDFYLVE